MAPQCLSHAAALSWMNFSAVFVCLATGEAEKTNIVNKYVKNMPETINAQKAPR